MTERTRFNFRRLSREEARRVYLRHFAELPQELLGTLMDKERYLNALSERTLDVVSVRPERGY